MPPFTKLLTVRLLTEMIESGKIDLETAEKAFINQKNSWIEQKRKSLFPSEIDCIQGKDIEAFMSWSFEQELEDIRRATLPEKENNGQSKSLTTGLLKQMVQTGKLSKTRAKEVFTGQKEKWIAQKRKLLFPKQSIGLDEQDIEKFLQASFKEELEDITKPSKKDTSSKADAPDKQKLLSASLLEQMIESECLDEEEAKAVFKAQQDSWIDQKRNTLFPKEPEGLDDKQILKFLNWSFNQEQEKLILQKKETDPPKALTVTLLKQMIEAKSIDAESALKAFGSQKELWKNQKRESFSSYHIPISEEGKVDKLLDYLFNQELKELEPHIPREELKKLEELRSKAEKTIRETSIIQLDDDSPLSRPHQAKVNSKTAIGRRIVLRCSNQGGHEVWQYATEDTDFNSNAHTSFQNKNFQDWPTYLDKLDTKPSPLLQIEISGSKTDSSAIPQNIFETLKIGVVFVILSADRKLDKIRDWFRGEEIAILQDHKSLNLFFRTVKSTLIENSRNYHKLYMAERLLIKEEQNLVHEGVFLKYQNSLLEDWNNQIAEIDNLYAEKTKAIELEFEAWLQRESSEAAEAIDYWQRWIIDKCLVSHSSWGPCFRKFSNEGKKRSKKVPFCAFEAHGESAPEKERYGLTLEVWSALRESIKIAPKASSPSAWHRLMGKPPEGSSRHNITPNTINLLLDDKTITSESAVLDLVEEETLQDCWDRQFKDAEDAFIGLGRSDSNTEGTKKRKPTRLQSTGKKEPPTRGTIFDGDRVTKELDYPIDRKSIWEIIVGNLKEAASVPSRIISPIFALFAPLMLLGIANPFKQSSKGIGKSVFVPEDNGLIFTFHWLVVALFVLSLMFLYWSIKRQKEKGKSSLKHSIVFAVISFLSIISVGGARDIWFNPKYSMEGEHPAEDRIKYDTEVHIDGKPQPYEWNPWGIFLPHLKYEAVTIDKNDKELYRPIGMSFILVSLFIALFWAGQRMFADKKRTWNEQLGRHQLSIQKACIDTAKKAASEFLKSWQEELKHVERELQKRALRTLNQRQQDAKEALEKEIKKRAEAVKEREQSIEKRKTDLEKRRNQLGTVEENLKAVQGELLKLQNKHRA